MADILIGPVTGIVDKDTFTLKVTRANSKSGHRYGDEERVKIVWIALPALEEENRDRTRELLEQELLGKTVECHIQSRDSFGNLLASVKVIDV